MNETLRLILWMLNSANFEKNSFLSLSLVGAEELLFKDMFVLQENLGAEGRSISKEKAGRVLGTCLSFLSQNSQTFSHIFLNLKIYANIFLHNCISKYR
jgi:hypothetical protein